MIPYARHSFSSAEARACAGVVMNGFLTQGPKVREFESAFAATCGVPYAVAVSSGTAGLHLGCLTAGFGPGDEVIVPALTFVATANAVVYCGARPVFADVDPETGNLTSETIKKRLTRKTKGVIVVHYAGQPVDLGPISRLAKKNRLVLLEDAAHAVGAEYRGAMIGSCRLSDLCVFSFHPAKTMTTGEGGMITTRNASWARRVSDLRNHGMLREPGQWKKKSRLRAGYYEIQETGFNYRLTDLQCAIGIEQLKKLPVFLKKRRAIVAAYEKAFSEIPQIRTLKQKWGRSGPHLFVIALRPRMGLTRNELLKRLHENGIGATVHYDSIPSHPLYEKHRPLCPQAENFSKSILSLPLYPDLSKKQISMVIAAVKKCVRAGETAPHAVWESGRVALRRVRPEDLNRRYLGWLNDKKVNRFLVKRNYDFGSMADYYGKFDPRGHFLAICDKATGRHIGNATLLLMQKRSAIYGILIGDRRYHGKGWGADASRAVSEFAFKKLGLKSLRLETFQKNRAAIAAFQKTGFKIVGNNFAHGAKTYKMTIHRKDLS